MLLFLLVFSEVFICVEIVNIGQWAAGDIDRLNKVFFNLFFVFFFKNEPSSYSAHSDSSVQSTTSNIVRIIIIIIKIDIIRPFWKRIILQEWSCVNRLWRESSGFGQYTTNKSFLLEFRLSDSDSNTERKAEHFCWVLLNQNQFNLLFFLKAKISTCVELNVTDVLLFSL